MFAARRRRRSLRHERPHPAPVRRRVVLFALLIVLTTRWTVIPAKSLNDNPLNQPHDVRLGADQARPHPRRRRHRAGQVGAGARAARGRGATRRGRSSPRPSGTPRSSRAAMPGSSPTTATSCAGTRPASTRCSASSTAATRSATTSTPRWTPRPSRWPSTSSAGQIGSVVALDPRTGSILAMYANPSYDDNNPNVGTTFDCLSPGPGPPRIDVQDRHHDGGHRLR